MVDAAIQFNFKRFHLMAELCLRKFLVEIHKWRSEQINVEYICVPSAMLPSALVHSHELWNYVIQRTPRAVCVWTSDGSK